MHCSTMEGNQCFFIPVVNAYLHEAVHIYRIRIGKLAAVIFSHGCGHGGEHIAELLRTLLPVPPLRNVVTSDGCRAPIPHVHVWKAMALIQIKQRFSIWVSETFYESS